jgi:hypothetical protein
LKKEFNNTSPGPNGGTLAFDDSVYIVSGPRGMPYLYAFKLFENITHPFASESVQLWNVSTPTLVVANVKTGFNDELTYYIESEGGDLVCIDTLKGEEKWRHKTGHNVVSEFTIINDEFLAFGTTNGYTSLLRIGNSPTATPSVAQSAGPTRFVSLMPSFFPTQVPSKSPSIVPTSAPSNVPSNIKSNIPSSRHSDRPSSTPTLMESNSPSSSISQLPTSFPTPSGTNAPTIGDTHYPSDTSEVPEVNSLEESKIIDESTSYCRNIHFGIVVLIVTTTLML